MRILAIESTGLTGSVALLEQDRLLAERDLPQDQRSAQSLVPTIQSVLADSGWPVRGVELIAVAQGPGSFTGLRVGITAAKTLAYAIGGQVLGIDTLECLAAQAEPSAAALRIHAILDAQRNQLFAASFGWATGEPFPRRLTATHIADIAPWLKEVAPGDYVIGPAAVKIQASLPDGVRVADVNASAPRAVTVGRLAWRDYELGRRDDLWKLLPHYHRLSAAEEKAAQRG